jgi:hypothetical protein
MLNLGVTAIIVKPVTLGVGDLGSNEENVHCSMLSSQNVSHIYKQLLSSKRISTCSIISSIWIIVKFWYSI